MGEGEQPPTTNLQHAHVFIEDEDYRDIPWPSEEVEIEFILKTARDRDPCTIKVHNCPVCASVKIVGKPCPICVAD